MEFQYGNSVEFVGYDGKRRGYCWEPEIGTVGRVVNIPAGCDNSVLVQWPDGSTIGDDKWWYSPEELKIVSNREIQFDVDPSELDAMFAEI